jgi:hypothetical protein
MLEAPIRKCVWRLDEHGYLRSPGGTVLGRLDGYTLLLYDHRNKSVYAFTVQDWMQLVGQQCEREQPVFI